MNKAVLAGWFARLLAIALSLVNTRLLVELTGIAGLAAHAVVASLLTWLTLLSFGLPAGMQNLTSEWRAAGRSVDDLRDTVTSLAALVFVATIPVTVGIAWLTRHYLLAGYPFVSVWAVVIACVMLSLSAIGTVFNQMLHADHRSLWPNIYPGLIAAVVCLLLTALTLAGQKNFNLVLSLYFVPAAAVVGIALRQLGLPKRWLLDRVCVGALWDRSRGYLLASFLGTVTLGLDYLILSRVLNESLLAAYNLSSRFFLVALSVHAVLLASAWSPMGDMFYRGEHERLRRYIWRLVGVGLTLGLAAGALILVLLPTLMRLLAGDAAPAVPAALVLLWWAYLLTRIWSDSFFTVLQSFGRADLLNRYIPFQAVISAGAQIVLADRYGAEGVLAGILVSFFLTCVWYLPRQSLRLLVPSSTGNVVQCPRSSAS